MDDAFDADKLRRLIAEYLGIDVNQVIDEAHFSDDLGIDWLDQLELMITIEDEFVGVELSDISAIELVGDLIRHIESKAASPGKRLPAARCSLLELSLSCRLANRDMKLLRLPRFAIFNAIRRASSSRATSQVKNIVTICEIRESAWSL